ncbi:MAG: hypothetical protein ACLQIB_22735 [Isosphaeraceae bacterium]
MILYRRNSRKLSVLKGPNRPSALILTGHVALAAAILVSLTGASEPEVIRVRVPAQDVSLFFPAGTELRVMTPAEFNAKVAAAFKGISLQKVDRSARLIRARHHACVSSGILTGRSELILEPSRAGPGEYVLEPWTPAIVPASLTANVVGARSDGKPTVWIDHSSNQTIQLEWELQARRYSRGRGFVLRLPGGETSVLSLEIPKDWEPSSRRGIRRGPLAAQDPARNLWEIDAQPGGIDLHIYDPEGSGQSSVGPIPWLTSATEVDLRGRKERARGVANWTTVWQIALDPRNSRQLTIELDPGLDLIDVSGPKVKGYRLQRQGPANRLEVALEGERNSPTELRILAHVDVPMEGSWTIPGARPLSAVWTGGTTTVLLDDDVAVKEWREKSGRRVFPSGATPGPDRLLVFESHSPGPAAELVFAQPRTDSSCEVRGQLFIGDLPTRLECQLSWKVQQGLLPELQIDLSPGWVPDQVRFREFSDPTTWHSLVLPSGVTRIRVAMPSAAIARQELTLELGANSTIPGGRGPLELPRARPVETRIADDVWLAWVDSDTIIRPSRARGLAWIDPKEAVGPTILPASTGELREALAWRWISDQGSAQIARERIDQEPRASITTTARIDPSQRVLLVDGRIVVNAGADALDAVPVWVNEPDNPLKSWRFQAGTGGPLLETRPLDRAAVARLGFPAGGSARDVVVKIRPGTGKTILFHAELPWTVQGPIPLLCVPGRYWSRGVIGIEVPPSVGSRVESAGLRRLDPSVIASPSTKADAEEVFQNHNELALRRSSNVHWFMYTEPTSRLDLATQLLTPFPLEGIIQEAVLTTTVRAAGVSLNRLRLLVCAGEARSLRIKPPGGVSIVRMRRDGFDIVPSQSQSGLSIPLESTSPGPRTSTIVLEYDAEDAIDKVGSRLRPALPQVGMPCLSFIWEIITPPGWEPADWGESLLADNPPDRPHWPFAALGLWRPWSLLYWGRKPGQESELYQELDGRLMNSAADTMSFGEWFTRWDSGPRPIVVDRLSLDLAGLGPRSPCVLNRVVNHDRSGISSATLRRNGLALVPAHGALVITTEENARDFEEEDRFREAVVQTLIWGSDRTDRLQTVARWRGEPSPKSASTAGEGITERSRLLPGWSSWRFSSSNWPTDTASIRVVDTRIRVVTAWLLAGILLIAYLLVREWLVRWRAWLPVSLMAGGAFLSGALPARFDGHAAAVVIAVLAVIILELTGGASRRSPPTQRTGQGSGEVLAGRMSRSIIGALFLGLLLPALTAAQPLPSPDRDTAILAFFPDEGATFDPKVPPKSVILRLSDFNRLDRLSRDASRRAPEPSLVRAVSASHRIARESARIIVVESEYELMVSGRSPGFWELPVASTRDIEATVDGKPQAISIRPGGLDAVVELPPSGRHVLRLRRTASTRTEANHEVLRVPINAMPFARVIVEPPRDGAGPGQLAAWGRIERGADLSLAGRLGPADRIEIRWPKPGSAAAARETGTVEGLILWDIHPAGDRLRARFKVKEGQNGATFRIRHDPNLILRSAGVSDLVDGFWVDSRARDEWTLHADPHIRPGSTISIDCWMPIAINRETSASAQAARGGRSAPFRRLPRLRPVGRERYSGILGVRRPGDWTGRLEPLFPTESIGDESFVRAWGNLSDEPLTVCGTSRFVGDCVATLRTGPTASRTQVKPTVRLNIESGRVAMTVEAELAELAGHVLQLDVLLPENFRIVEVGGEGLTGWRAGLDRQLRLMFDSRVARPKRVVRIVGWIPVSDDPLKVSQLERRLATPWIRGEGIEFATGFLTISSASKTSVHGAAGLTSISSESSPAVGSMPPRQRFSYQVDDPQRLGEIVWESSAPRVSVAIESQLTLYPDSAEWVAVLRYDVSGGSLDAIHLRMPAAWSGAAELLFTGGEYRLTKEPLGPSSFWTITPKHPIWGSERFVLRSALPLPADRAVVHPELAPLGWGAVDACVGVVNATGRPLSIEKSTGLQDIPYAARFRSREFVADVGVRLAAFRVMSKEWTLQVKLARNGSDSEAQEQARVALADLLISISADGSATGRAAYDLYSGSGRTLSFELPANGTLLGATIDSNPATTLRDSARRWSIVLENHHPSRVCLIWRTPAVSTLVSGTPVSLELPRAGIGQSPALVALHVAPYAIIDGDLSGLERVATSRLELARADRLGRAIGDLVSRIDRSSGRDHEKLVSLLINQELALRDAERSIRWSEPSGLNTAAGRSQRDSALIESARGARLDILRRAGLEDDLASAQAYLGQSPKGVERTVIGAPELYASDRIRSPGDRTTFVGVVPGVDGPPTRNWLTIESQSGEGFWHLARTRAMLILLVLVGIYLATAVLRRRAWIGSPALVLVLTVTGYWGGPLVALGGLGLTAMSWWTRPLRRTAL